MEPNPYQTGTQQPNHGQNCGEAIASLVCGICVFLLGPIAGIPAVITGHIARAKIRKSEGAISGSGMALTGLILGYASIIVVMLAVLIHVVLLLVGGWWLNERLNEPEKKVDFLPHAPIERSK